MRALAHWPAVHSQAGGPAGFEGLELVCEQGVWGKVHGAASDFRWIARSSALPGDLAAELRLGTEDEPRRTVLWRSLPHRDAACAVHVYPSRAIDAAGRGGFLEKQILLWRGRREIPAALGALALLPRVAERGDEIWWQRTQDGHWTEDGFSLEIRPNDRVSLRSDELEKTLEQGLAALRRVVTKASLAHFYAALDAGLRPALLPGLIEPLGPRALAVLLLPLPREQADRLSLAGWVPASRWSPSALVEFWDGLGVPATDSSPAWEPAILERGEQRAQALWEGDPSRLPRIGVVQLVPDRLPEDPLAGLPDVFLDPDAELMGSRIEEHSGESPEPAAAVPLSTQTGLDSMGQTQGASGGFRPGCKLALSPQPYDAPPWLVELFEFAREIDRRWLAPGRLADAGGRELGNDRQPAEGQGELLRRWAAEVEAQRPPWADVDQWAAKVSCLRAAARCVSPQRGKANSTHLPSFERRWMEEWERFHRR